MNRHYYTVNEYAELLRVSTQTVRNMCRAGRLECVRIGRQWRIPGKAEGDVKTALRQGEDAA